MKDSVKKNRLRPGIASDSKAELSILREKVIELVLRDPKRAAMILTAWIHSPSKKKAA